MTTDDVHDSERRAAGLQQQIDKSPQAVTIYGWSTSVLRQNFVI